VRPELSFGCRFSGVFLKDFRSGPACRSPPPNSNPMHRPPYTGTAGERSGAYRSGVGGQSVSQRRRLGATEQIKKIARSR